MRKFGRKGISLPELASIAIIFVVAGIALGIGAQVLGNISATFSSGSIAKLSVDNASMGIQELSKWMPTIGLVIAAAIIIGVIFSSFVRGKVAGE